MYIVKVMKRKDASSVLVAIVAAFIVSELVQSLTAEWAGKLSGLKEGQYFAGFPNAGWKGTYLYPIVAAILKLLVLEIVIRIYVAVHEAVRTRR